ncbi:alpha-amylase-like [Penaeus chinensis]|uniref:alpha-amylase-like n=1 Tax=Penaeus chinensis TaxID=139456 RepID=UPI001FB606D8|nr:alpha-amylase-like [Penaeus chinensis]
MGSAGLYSLVLVLLWAGGGRAGVGYENPACDGKTVIVHLFEWKWTDVALECERFLAHAGYCGVQVSPPNEHLTNPPEYPYPWWQRYQPVSYKLVSRSGSEEEFVDMVRRCNAVGVRIFVDAVVNHMAALGRKGTGSGGTPFDGDAHDFPGVPYTAEHFTPKELCPSGDGNVNNYGDPNNVRNCNLVALTDLYGATDYVRKAVAGYFSKLVDIGVAGFRVDAAKHMWPEDLAAMMDLTNDLNTAQGFPPSTRPFFYLEVIDRNDGAVTVQEYYGMGRVTEFRYSQKIAWGVQNPGQLEGVYDPGWGMADPDKAFVFVDNHDNQRGHGGAGDTLTHKFPKDYRLGVAFTLAQPYGFARVMSSYAFGDDSDAGPPHLSDYSTANVVINSDNQCDGGWVCEHRWASIYKMVRFSNAVKDTAWWENYYCDGNVVAFSRGDKGFFAMVKYGTVSQTFQTGMPAGTYQDVVSCQDVTVNGDGSVHISITNEEEPVFAICVGCDCSEPPVVTATPGPDQTTTTTTTTQGPTEPSITEGIHRTVVFIQKQTNDGQDLFVRGGIDAGQRPGCTNDVSTDPCAIDIAPSSLGASSHYNKYNAWRQGDNRLDWMGAEQGQGSYNGQAASGTPLAWTSSNPGSPGYQELNTFGDHYWMVDMDMDCSQTEEGWFELKAFLTNAGNGWEADISQIGSCSGTAGGSAPYASKNHLGRCGFVNVFTFDSSDCTVNSFPDYY